MMGDHIIIGIDPGPLTSGLVVYRTSAGCSANGHGVVIRSDKAADLDRLRMELDAADPATTEVVLECTQAGPPSTQVVKTTEVVGRLMEACDVRGLDCYTYYRREVLQALGCARKGNKDSLVRLACIELHGGDRPAAIGNKKTPGPLYGVSSHAWQALGAVCAHVLPF
jgi:Holliday junction resolvasome RuvABC endonuclease subunit